MIHRLYSDVRIQPSEHSRLHFYQSFARCDRSARPQWRSKCGQDRRHLRKGKNFNFFIFLAIETHLVCFLQMIYLQKQKKNTKEPKNWRFERRLMLFLWFFFINLFGLLHAPKKIAMKKFQHFVQKKFFLGNFPLTFFVNDMYCYFTLKR